jgi:hypothetical protein
MSCKVKNTLCTVSFHRENGVYVMWRTVFWNWLEVAALLELILEDVIDG